MQRFNDSGNHEKNLKLMVKFKSETKVKFKSETNDYLTTIIARPMYFATLTIVHTIVISVFSIIFNLNYMIIVMQN